MEENEDLLSQEDLDAMLALTPRETDERDHHDPLLTQGEEESWPQIRKKAVKLIARIKADDENFGTDLEELYATVSALDADFKENVSIAVFSARFCHESVLDVLIADGLDLNERDNFGESALCQAAAANDIARLRLLILKGADVNASSTTAEGNALMQACDYDNVEAAKVLLEAGADANCPHIDTWKPMHLAAMHDSRNLIELLLAYGALIDAQTKYGRTPLFEACSTGSVETAGLLLDKGANINHRDFQGQSCLVYALSTPDQQNKARAIAKFLLGKGADIHAVDNGGCNAIVWASIFGDTNFARQLMALGADPHQRVVQTGKDAFDYARGAGNTELLSVLENKK